MSEKLEKQIAAMYEEFKQVASKKSGVTAEDFSREDKLALMKDSFVQEFGHFASTESAFSAFYAQDLLVFGLENDIVEAVRLGEKVMSENGYVAPLEIQKAVKEYLVINSEKYQKAMKKTGPIDNTSLYRNVRNRRETEAA